MPHLRPNFYQETNNTKTNQYIETGSYRGDGVDNVMKQYAVVHSIELSPTWYEHCYDRFKGISNVHIHLGNSKNILPEILKDINEPVTVYLDGHYSAGETAFGDEEINGVSSNPLIGELEVLMSREYNDIIIIDDCRMIGRKDFINRGVKNGLWPEYEYDWTNITEEKILSMLKPGYKLFKNNEYYYSDGAPDQWILAVK